ncbi:MAG: hypothetical protein V3S64_05995 [bacterium]
MEYPFKNAPPHAGGATKLAGVNHVPYEASKEEIQLAQQRARSLVAQGVEFGDRPIGQVPWLVAMESFVLPREERGKVERLGAATFEFLDAVQALYGEGHPVVIEHLDSSMPPDLRRLNAAERVMTFRLDIVLRDGAPKITEIEEIYGNVGKMAALEKAYGVDNEPLFRRFAIQDFSHIYVDDTLPQYISELELLRRRLAEGYGQDVKIEYFSKFPADQRGTVWRFCKTKDFAQYPAELQRRIVGAECRFVNPLFHGYGTKAVLALPFHPELQGEFRRRLGEDTYRAVQEGFTRSRLLEENPEPAVVAELTEGYKTSVLKVVDCPHGLDYTWGSRGVFFGDRSASRWRKVVEAAAAGLFPGDPDCREVRYIVSELVESDRFHVPFLHPGLGVMALMPRARIRLAPIFFRDEGGARLVAGHATFVNTSRKIHLGAHAVCAPLAWDRFEGDFLK